MTWATIHRAHGLLDHPNHLGHVLGLVLIGLLAWMTGLPRVTRGWWLAFARGSARRSRRPSRGSRCSPYVAAGVLILFLRRSGGRTVVAACTVLVVLFAGNLLVRPENVSELLFRLRGVVSAVDDTQRRRRTAPGFETMQGVREPGGSPRGRSGSLFFQQGARLLAPPADARLRRGAVRRHRGRAARPELGARPALRPGGFNLYDFDGTTVDTFWLHLAVETGVLGLAAYLVWLWLLAVPLLGVTRRYVGRKVWGARGPRGRRMPQAQPLRCGASGR